MKIIKKSSCIIVADGSAIVGSFAGPDAERHAEIFVAAIDVTQPPQDERGQGIVSKTVIDTEPRAVESLPIEVKIDPDANNGVIKIAAQPVALSTLTDEQMEAQRKDWTERGGFFHRFNGEDHACIPLSAWRASAPAQQATPPQPVAAEVAKAQRYDWLKARLLCADFQYGEPSEACSALVFKIPESMRVSANLDETIDAAMAGTGSDESKKGEA